MVQCVPESQKHDKFTIITQIEIVKIQWIFSNSAMRPWKSKTWHIYYNCIVCDGKNTMFLQLLSISYCFSAGNIQSTVYDFYCQYKKILNSSRLNLLVIPSTTGPKRNPRVFHPLGATRSGFADGLLEHPIPPEERICAPACGLGFDPIPFWSPPILVWCPSGLEGIESCVFNTLCLPSHGPCHYWHCHWMIEKTASAGRNSEMIVGIVKKK